VYKAQANELAAAVQFISFALNALSMTIFSSPQNGSYTKKPSCCWGKLATVLAFKII